MGIYYDFLENWRLSPTTSNFQDPSQIGSYCFSFFFFFQNKYSNISPNAYWVRKKLTSFSSDSDMPLSLGTTGLDDIMTPKKSHKVQEISHKV